MNLSRVPPSAGAGEFFFNPYSSRFDPSITITFVIGQNAHPLCYAEPPDMRILVVEDDNKIASFIAKGLKQAGYAVDRCADGEEALVLAETTPTTPPWSMSCCPSSTA
jgi:hypothetical protein